MANQYCFLPINKDRKFVTLKGNVLKTQEKESYKKKGTFYVGFLDSKSLIHSPLDVEKSIPEDALEDYITTKTYEDLGLDFNVEYIIKFHKKEIGISPEYDEYDIFAISTEALESRFEYALKSVKHIDYVTIAPFLFHSLYKSDILPKESVHCFAYIGYTDSFLTLYRDGKFLYVKSMEFSLEELFKKFSFIHPNVLNLSEFLTILENDEEKYQDGVDKIYNDIGSYIADILLYIKRVYSLDIDNFYIDSDGKLNDVFFKYIGSYIDLTPQRFDFDCKFVGEPITHLSKLALLDASFYSNDNINFSVFEKEKAFIYKDSGRLILTTLASLLIAFLYPIFNYSYAYIVDIQKSNESELLLKHESVANEYRLLFRALDSKKQEFIHRKERVQNEIKSVKDLMIKIKNKKSKYRLKIAKIVEVLKSFNNFSIKSMNLNIDGNEILTIYTISKDEEEITKFVKEINSIYDVDVKKISFDKSEYISEIKIKELK